MADIISYIIAAIGVFIGLYFGLTSRKRRELTYSVNLVRTRIVSSKQVTDLKVTYGDESLGNVDITAAQLAIWNAGNESIEKEDIRKDIVIFTRPQVRILEVVKRYESPEIVFDMLVSIDSKTNGEIPVTWETLEKNEGASIQLLYLDTPPNTPEVEIFIRGRIKGQGQPKRLSTSSSFKSPQVHHKELRNIIIWASISFVALILLSILRFVFNIQGTPDIIALLFTLSVLSFPFSIIALLQKLSEKFPPFGF